jgi:NADH:ubiquinone oxidoreductase subunit 5 (subunit L)/multisubunit Na+/H+ antiporter MnhA subunit
MDPRAALLLLVVFAPLVSALAILAFARRVGRAGAWGLAVAASISFLAALELARDASGGSPVRFAVEWMPALGVSLALRGDGFGLFFALVVAGIGLLVSVYSFGYVEGLPPERIGRYYAALGAFMGSMLGIVLSDDLVLLAVFWEGTSIASFLLIGFWYEEEKARHGANVALQVTALGGLAMLAGFILIGQASGTYSISALLENPALRERVAASPLFPAAFLLVFVGIATKSAQVPFHFWLPAAMVAPTPVSTYLHAATMVKAGVFLAGRLQSLLGASPLWAPCLGLFGLATFLVGAVQAFQETDLKGILARTTVSALGAMIFLYGIGSTAQDSLQILSHAAYKGALFLGAGIVEHAAGTRELGRLGGLRRRLPVTFVLFTAAAASMAGLPPSLGFVAKETLYGALLEAPGLPESARWAAIAAAVAGNAFLFATAWKLVAGIFLGSSRAPVGEEEPTEPAGTHDEGAVLWVPAAVLAGAAIGLGILALRPELGGWLGSVSSVPDGGLRLSLVPEHPGPAVLSVLTILLGLALPVAWVKVCRAGVARTAVFSAEWVWNSLLDSVVAAAEAFACRWQNGHLRWYFSGTLLFAAALPWFSLEFVGPSVRDIQVDLENVTLYGVALCGLTAIATLAVVRARTRLAAALALTSVGFLVATIFVVYRSPDIVLTQILIETVSTIFVLLVLYFLPPFPRGGLAPGETAWNGLVATAVGTAVFAALALATSPTLRAAERIATDYLSRSLPEAGGRNVVNVIIVDFRAMDTIGEITVLVVVGLCIYGILRARRRTA